MLRWLMVLLVLSAVTLVLGFTRLFGNSIGLARTLFVVYAGAAALTAAIGLMRGRL